MQSLYGSANPIIADCRHVKSNNAIEDLSEAFIGTSQEPSLEAYREMRMKLNHVIHPREHSGFIANWNTVVTMTETSQTTRRDPNSAPSPGSIVRPRHSQRHFSSPSLTKRPLNRQHSQSLNQIEEMPRRKPRRQTAQLPQTHLSNNNKSSGERENQDENPKHEKQKREKQRPTRSERRKVVLQKHKDSHLERKLKILSTNEVQHVDRSSVSQRQEGKPSVSQTLDLASPTEAKDAVQHELDVAQSVIDQRTSFLLLQKKLEEHGQSMPVPLRADLQERMEVVFNSLCMNASDKLRIVLKYTNRAYSPMLEGALKLWEAASISILEREKILEKIRQFEMDASDPRRHFNTISTKRLSEAKERRVLDLAFAKVSKTCREQLLDLSTDYGDDLMYHNHIYLEKMKIDYVQTLHEIEELRYRRFIQKRLEGTKATGNNVIELRVTVGNRVSDAHDHLLRELNKEREHTL